MKVKVRYFALFKEMLGISEEEIDIDPSTTVETFRDHVLGIHPKLAVRNEILVAINGSFVSLDTVINEEDVVAFFPPVSGG